MFNNSTTLSAESENTLANKMSLLNITEKNGIQTVSARELYKGLEISWRFSEWFEVNSKDFIEGEDFTSVVVPTQVQNNGGIQIKELQDYAISIDMAKAICLMSKTEIGKKYRTYLITLEKAWNEPGAVMARALQIANKTLDDCKNQIAIMKPKAEFYDAVTGSKDCIEIGTTAKVLNLPKIGRNKLFEILRVENVLQNDNLPYQRFVDLGYFRVVESKWTTPNGDTKINLKTIVSQKGVAAIRKLLIKKGYVDITSQEYLDQAIPAAAEKYIQAMPSDN